MKFFIKITLALIFIAIFIMLLVSDINQKISLDSLPLLREKILSFGWASILIFWGFYVFVCLFSLPGLPATLLGALIFGPLWGTVYTVISASSGLALSFLVARYIAGDFLKQKFQHTDAFQKINEGIQKEGWRILIVTRLIPIFPFSIQNYIYGLTQINFFSYWFFSTLFIIPGTAAYTLSAGAILSGQFNSKNSLYLALGALCFVFLSFIPKFIKTKHHQ